MPGIEDQPPTAEQVSIIRKKFQDYITENGRGMYFKDHTGIAIFQRVIPGRVNF